ncbi:MAG: hypothetical protein R6W73_05285 [Candidatus Saliniplasma sp.]
MDDEKKDEKKEKPETLLIASYGQKYSKESLEEIKKIINRSCPERVAILKIIKERPETEIVEAYIGHDKKEKIYAEVQQAKKQHADEVASDLIDIMDEFDIPYGVYLRTGGDVSKEITEEFERMNIKKVIIHKSIKGKLEKLIDSSIADKVIKNIGRENITLLD